MINSLALQRSYLIKAWSLFNDVTLYCFFLCFYSYFFLFYLRSFCPRMSLVEKPMYCNISYSISVYIKRKNDQRLKNCKRARTGPKINGSLPLYFILQEILAWPHLISHHFYSCVCVIFHYYLLGSHWVFTSVSH